MARKVKDRGIFFRPHFKTHQSAGVGEWFKENGVNAITVSSVQMAAYFAGNGWRDITIAFPVNRLEIAEINRLSREVSLNLLVESKDTVSFLAKALDSPVKLWLKIDTGYHRTGLEWDNMTEISTLARAIEKAPGLEFSGLLTHSGHTYRAQSVEEVKLTLADAVTKLNRVRTGLKARGVPNCKISIGDTPGCSLAENFPGVDEIRCGNFVFYDLMQYFLGACKEEDISVALACPVVALHPRRNEIVIYGGAVHLSKDFVTGTGGEKIYGLAALPGKKGWGPVLSGTHVSSLSQEHGIVKTAPATLKRVKVGDLLLILPVHSCLTANLMRRYLTLEGRDIPTAQS